MSDISRAALSPVPPVPNAALLELLRRAARLVLDEDLAARMDAGLAGDPDGPLVPLPAKVEPARVVPAFPLVAYRVLVDGFGYR